MQRRLWLITIAVLIALEVVLSPTRLAASVHHGLVQGAASSSTTDAAAVSLLTAIVGGAAWLCAAWLVLLCLLDALAVLPGRCGRRAERVRRAMTPRLVARLLYSGLAASSALGVATPALAATASPPPTVASRAFAATSPLTAPFPDLDRPATAATTGDVTSVTPSPSRGGSPDHAVNPRATIKPQSTTDNGSAAGAGYTVRPGDTLWALAAAELAADESGPPSNSAIAARWPAWWQANRDEIGTDPGLLVPGEHLTQPPQSR